jgi:thiamine-phosphate pyrophosphorylase
MFDLQPPIIYQITSGTTTAQTTPEDPQFSNILRLIQAAVDAHVSLIQIREKALSARVLYELTARAVDITRGSKTLLLVNDRSDIARAAGADGVHLTSQSLPANVIRETRGPDFLIGVSTHSRDEVFRTQDAGADFVVFGPVFDTESKRVFGEPQGLETLQAITGELQEFPVVAIGGITLENVEACFQSGVRGVAAIRLFNDAEKLASIVGSIKSRWFAREGFVP